MAGTAMAIMLLGVIEVQAAHGAAETKPIVPVLCPIVSKSSGSHCLADPLPESQ
jgi:hypothetical protein